MKIHCFSPVGISLSGHAFLWKHSIKHNDPSLWNAKYNPIRKCGVLTDFDLPAVSWRRHVLETDRTGTILFMALELMFDRYGKEKVARRYHHELEAFIWILSFVFLAHDDGKLVPQNGFTKDWITSDPTACRKEKWYFIADQLLPDSVSLVGSAFENYEWLMFDACFMVFERHSERQREATQIFLQRMRLERGKISESAPAPHIDHSVLMWDQFIFVLSRLGFDTTRLLNHRPAFDRAQCQDLFSEMANIYNSPPPRYLSQRAIVPHLLQILINRFPLPYSLRRVYMY